MAEDTIKCVNRTHASEVEVLLYNAIKEFAPKAETAEEVKALAAISDVFFNAYWNAIEHLGLK